MKSYEDDALNKSYKTSKKRSLRRDIQLALDIVEVKKERIRKAKLVQMAKTNKKPGKFWIIYLSIFMAYLAAVLSALIVLQALINNHSNSTNELFKITMIYSDCNYHLTNSAPSLIEYKSVAYSESVLTAADHAMINNSFFTDDFFAFKQDSMTRDYLELAQKITEINDHLVNSKQLVDIGYSRDEFDRSYIWNYNVTNNTLAAYDSNRKSHVDIRLITLQSIRKFRIALGNELSLSQSDFGAIINEVRSFMIDKGLGDISNRVHQQESNSRFRFVALTDQYRVHFFSTIGTVSSIVALIFVLWMVALYMHRRDIASILETYCVLNFQTLEVELERIHNVEKALYLNTFNAIENMKYARRNLNDLIPEQRIALDHEKGTNEQETESFARKSDKKSAKSIMVKGRGKNHFSNSSKFTYGPPIKVFWYSFIMILLLIVIWGIEAILLVKIGVIVQDSNTIKQMAMTNIEHCMKLRVDYSKYFKLSPYVVLFHDAKQIQDAYSELRYNEDHERYLQWWTKNQGVLIESFGKDSTFEITQNGDLCTLELKPEYADEHEFQQAWAENVKLACQTGLNGALKKGYFQYSIYEANIMKTVKQKLEPIIKDIYTLDKTTLEAKLREVWYAPKYVQLRGWHQQVYSNLLAIVTTQFQGDIEQKTAAAESFIKTLGQVGIVLAILPLLFYVLVVIPMIRRAYHTSLFTFDAISPLAIVSNQLSMNKYKSYYSVTSN